MTGFVIASCRSAPNQKGLHGNEMARPQKPGPKCGVLHIDPMGYFQASAGNSLESLCESFCIDCVQANPKIGGDIERCSELTSRTSTLKRYIDKEAGNFHFIYI